MVDDEARHASDEAQFARQYAELEGRVQAYFEANGLHFDVEYISKKVMDTDNLDDDFEAWFARAKAAIMEDTML